MEGLVVIALGGRIGVVWHLVGKVKQLQARVDNLTAERLSPPRYL